MKKTFTTQVAGRTLIVEVGQLAQLANGAALVRYGETVVISAATASTKPREGIDFFPLSVEYEEKMYAVGKIPGGFIKREGRPTERAILTGRVIDRQMRPRFPKDLRNDVSLVNTVMSVEQDNSPEFAAIFGSAVALAISDIPFRGPIAGIILGLVDGVTVINPTAEQREKSDMYLTLSADTDKIIMIEAGANQVPDEVMLSAIRTGHEEIRELIRFIDTIVAEVGKPKFEYESVKVNQEVYERVAVLVGKEMKQALLQEDKATRDVNVSAVCEIAYTALSAEFPGMKSAVSEALYYLQKKIVRKLIMDEGKRVDGRGLNDIRSLSSEVNVLPRTHGSGLFQRGQTQVLTTVTLGPVSDIQILDGVDLEDSKRYIHHYNFPSYSVGETKISRGPGRREIGHGALAERALEPVIPAIVDFPYAIRLVSEVLMSNGSTSQGSICASTLALMDAGVPLIEPVAGISAGLIVDDENGKAPVVFMDIQGIEDFFGDMDFKVGGTKNGITAVQVDIKTDGLTYDVLEQAFEMTRKGRMLILNESILTCLPEPRKTLSKYAPKIYQMKIDVDKIREVIGPGGKVINKIIQETGVKIDIEDDGSIFIATSDEAAGMKALQIIEGIVGNVEVGSVYSGRVTRLMNFGAFVEFLPGKEGLVHISKLSHARVNKVEDVVQVGDEIMVRVMEVDKQGRINLSRKDAMPEPGRETTPDETRSSSGNMNNSNARA